MTLLNTIIILSLLGALLSTVLYFVAKKFQVVEDPRIDEVEKRLPGANCGGCGFAGCRAFATAMVESDSSDGLFCPVGGDDVNRGIADFLGKSAPVREPRVARVRCSGSCAVRPRINFYDGAGSCAIEASLYGGETGCSFGCLGKGDCVAVCNFGALRMNEQTGLPEVDEEKCTACGMCEKACPKMLIELRKKAPKGRGVYVSCRNRDKGGVARKACTAACIGCGKCVKVCAFDAIVVENNLAFIDSQKCRLCRKCVAECPTGAIVEVGFPPRKSAEEKAA